MKSCASSPTAQRGNGEGSEGLAQNSKAGLWRFKDWLRQRNPWLADIWRLRRIQKPGMKYDHFEERQFPKIGKLQNPLVPYLEMVRRRHAEFNKSRLEASTAFHLCCAGYLRKKKCKDTARPCPSKRPFAKNRLLTH